MPRNTIDGMPGPLEQRLAPVAGDRAAKLLEKGLGLKTVGDLLTHYPRRYIKRGSLFRDNAAAATGL